ncbi:hypothetical protein Tco_0091267 [Tanacetum coccineum]
MEKGYQVFLAQVTKKKTEVKSKEKRLEDKRANCTRNVWNSYPEDIAWSATEQKFEFQIELSLVHATCGKSPIKTCSAEMAKLSRNCQNIYTNDFIRSSFLTRELRSCCQKEKDGSFRCLSNTDQCHSKITRFGISITNSELPDRIFPKTAF